MTDERVLCLTPTQGKQGTWILKWKYELVKSTLLEVVPKDAKGVLFKQLPALLDQTLTNDQLTKLGSLSWYTTTVKLDLEVHGEIERVPGSNPQRLRRIQ